MSVSKSKTRITISPTNEILSQVDALAHRMGFTRSQTISFLVTQGLESYATVSKLPPDTIKALVDVLDTKKE